jgi:tetratricopeptide (TPR) repeat protein
MPRAKKSAEKALQIDEKLAEAHVSLAHVKFFYDWDWSGAEREYQRAIELNPNYATAHQWYGDLLMIRKGREATLAEKKRALELDPTSPIIAMDLGSTWYNWRDYDRVIEYCRTTLDMDESFLLAHILLARALVQKKKYPEAISELHLVRNSAPQFSLPLALLGHAYGVSGQRDEAKKAMADLQKMAQVRYVPPHEFAAIHLGLGEHQKALDLLEKAFQEHSGLMVYLKLEPVLDPLRGERRFKELVRKVGL